MLPLYLDRSTLHTEAANEMADDFVCETCAVSCSLLTLAEGELHMLTVFDWSYMQYTELLLVHHNNAWGQGSVRGKGSIRT